MSYISASKVFTSASATTIEEVFAFLSDKAVELGIADDRDAIVEAFKAREAMGTTGMNDGFAIPHAKTDAVKEPSLIAVKLDAPIEWESHDGQPISYIVALFAQASDPTTYLGLLSKVAVMLANEKFREGFVAADDAEKIAELIAAGL